MSQEEFPNNPGDPHAIAALRLSTFADPFDRHDHDRRRSWASAGDLFLAPYQGEGTPGPMIAEQDGALVWFHPLARGDESTNFQVQRTKASRC